ncbi:hypothetical protein T440DRAFT_464506 [Plenodomus tracheiphilus IPT5]|uniref:Uncharacterized protein n=1 Tax=Plenodomus tracheiphilus IPT5 TaxID=1408161 RepID=A0A6A7BL66_9PLEO|nr:hypothetical protein T440DRAFT_464506 [Plenodomus tracheiphilus IPT5]
MGLFSSSTEKSVLERYPNNPDITKQSGSGAEQDRYGQHFAQSTDKINEGINKGVDKVKGYAQDAKGYAKDAAQYKGDGAEQDRYNAHFSPSLHSLDAKLVGKAAASYAAKGPSQASYHGLGYDGQQRAKLLAGSGAGAEQDRLAQHFALNRDAVVAAAQRLKDGAKDVLERR